MADNKCPKCGEDELETVVYVEARLKPGTVRNLTATDITDGRIRFVRIEWDTATTLCRNCGAKV